MSFHVLLREAINFDTLSSFVSTDSVTYWSIL